jgi:hypothetical protein
MVSDTHPKIEAMMLEAYRRMTPAQKIARVQALNETVLQMAAARLKKQYGEMSERELRLRLASLWLDRATMIRVFHWDPEQHGR